MNNLNIDVLVGPERFDPDVALVVVDMQNDFVDPQGSLYVKGAESLVEPIKRLAKLYGTVVYTQDWHPAGHVSFASRYGVVPFSTVGGAAVVWPDHCVQWTWGARHVWKDVSADPGQTVFHLRKGTRLNVDSYSAFVEDDGTPTGLSEHLRKLGVESVDVVGVALDYCVLQTAIGALCTGFKVSVFPELTAAVNEDTGAEAVKRMKSYGITVGQQERMK